VADELESGPAFVELMKQSQSALAGLQALEEHLSTRLADQHAQLKATRTELEQTREAMAGLQGAHERLTAEHTRTLDELAHHRNARAGLDAAVLEVRGELAQALRERDELNRTWDKERGELEDRLASQEAALIDRLNRITSLEVQVDELAAAQVSWQAERDTLIESRDRLGGRLRDLEAGQRQAQDDLARAIHNREQLRAVFEELKETHATSAERSAAAFRELARLQDELRAAAERASAQERAITLVREELARAKASSDELQTHQLTWAADRENLLAAAKSAERRLIALEAELAKAQLALTERTTVSEGDLARLRQEAAAVKMQLSDERARLEASLAAANDQLRLATEAATTADKARGEAQAQIARLVERAQAAAQEWGARRESMTEENLRLSDALVQARQAQRSAEDSQRQLQARLQQVEQANREKLATLEAQLRSAEDAASRPLTQVEAHRINTRLNAIMGFASILLDPSTNAIGAREQAEYIRLVDENSRALGEDLRLVPVAGAVHAAEPADHPASEEAAAGPSVASLKGDPAPPAVLVADPDPAVREAIAPFLTRAGYTVAYASSRQEAVEQAAALSPVVILADATLQSGGVAALIADLQRDPRTADIPVVVTTGNAEQPLGVELGQVDVLSKPIDRQQLLQMMINHDLQADARRARKLPARVLVIDDDPLSLRLLTAVLKPLKIEVTTAGGGKAGLELAKQTDPQLIICDLTMPDVDGFSVIAALRADPQTSAVPILVYTGKTITLEDQQRLQGLIPSIIRKGDFSRERFLEMLLKRGERRSRATPPIAA
jgi:CheY-like chemotaxis protein/chromosome segregation ATPase